MLCNLKTPYPVLILTSFIQRICNSYIHEISWCHRKFFFLSSKHYHDDENTTLIIRHNTKWNPSKGLLENIWQLHDITFYCYATTKSLKDNDTNQASYHWQAQIQKRKVLPNLLSWMSRFNKQQKVTKNKWTIIWEVFMHSLHQWRDERDRVWMGS